MSEESKEIMSIDDVKCPYCGNPVNWKKFSHWMGEQACFIVGCWSGDTRKDAPEHIFKIWVTVDREVVVNQPSEEEA